MNWKGYELTNKIPLPPFYTLTARLGLGDELC